MATIETTLGAIYVDDHGDPQQPTALMWPSLFTDHRMWRNQIPVLRDAGWRTLAVDPPCHGQSPGPGRGFTMDECAQAAIDILDASGVTAPTVAFGTSWGGFVAPRIARIAPTRLAGMVLFNTSAERGSTFERMKAGLLARLLSVGALDTMTGPMILSGLLTSHTRRENPALGTELASQFLGWDRRHFVTAVRSVLIDRDATLGALPGVEVPALIVSGEQDQTLPSVHSRRMVDKLPNARHVEVAGAAHLVPLEASSDANRLILDFLGELRSASAP